MRAQLQSSRVAEQYILYLSGPGAPEAIFASRLERLPDFWDALLSADELEQRITTAMRRQVEFVQALGFFDSEATLELRIVCQPGSPERIRLYYIISVERGGRAEDAWRLFHSSFPNDLDYRLTMVPVDQIQAFRDPLLDRPATCYEWTPQPLEYLSLPGFERDVPIVQQVQMRQDSKLQVLRLLGQQSDPVVLGYAIQPVGRTDALVQSAITAWHQRLRVIETVLALADSAGGVQELDQRLGDSLDAKIDQIIGNMLDQHWTEQAIVQDIRQEVLNQYSAAPRYLLEHVRDTTRRLLQSTRLYRWRVHAAVPQPFKCSKELMSAISNDLSKGENQAYLTDYAFKPVDLEPGQKFYEVSPYSWWEIEHDSQGQYIPRGELIDDQAASALIGMPILPRGGIPGIPAYTANPFAGWHLSDQLSDRNNSIMLGEYVDSRMTLLGAHERDFTIDLDDLTRHTLVTGSTGAGKTTTCKRLLVELHKRRLPFLVIEPVKQEYDESTFKYDLWVECPEQPLEVFRLGEVTNSMWFNPFYVPPGISLNTHISYLQSCFFAAFPMPGIFGLVFAKIIREAYKRKSHKFYDTNNFNSPVKPGLVDANFPDLNDMKSVAIEIITGLHYAGEFATNLTAATLFRIEALQQGIIGDLLTPRNSPSFQARLDHVMDQSSAFQLGRIGDKSEKALMMAFLLTAIYEYYAQRPTVERLKHVTLIEEAHVLLENVPRNQHDDSANTRGKAIEIFADMLAEIRSRGEGLVIAEQLPSKLIPEAIKNTNLKIMHRLTARDDRDVLGAAMNFDERQSRFATTLERGQAIVFREGLSEPALVTISPALGFSNRNHAARDQVDSILQYDAATGHPKWALEVIEAFKICEQSNFANQEIQSLIDAVYIYLDKRRIKQLDWDCVLWYCYRILSPFRKYYRHSGAIIEAIKERQV